MDHNLLDQHTKWEIRVLKIRCLVLLLLASLLLSVQLALATVGMNYH